MPKLNPLLLAALGLAPLLLGACDTGGAIEPLADGSPPALRNVMFEIDALNRSVEPVLRDRSQFAAIASAARSMENWAKNEAWTAYLDEPVFLGNAPRYQAYLGWLQAGLAELAQGAEAEDVDVMRAGFVRTQQSCIACHKRYQPNI